MARTRTRLSVLLVEDDPDDHILTRDLLAEAEDVGFTLHWVRSVAEGLAALREERPDVVLLDYRLGRQTGLDFLGRMSAEDSTPVILLTGQSDRDTDVRAMEAGADDYLVKGELTATLLERSIRYAVERAHAQRAQQRSEAHLAQLFESAPEGVVLIGCDDRVLRVNPEFSRIFGYTAEEAIGRYLNDLIVPEHLRGEGDSYTRDVSCGQALRTESVRRRKDGSTLEVSILGAPVWAGGEQVGVYGIYRDVTERKQAEEALRASEESYRSLFDSLSELVYILDLECRFIEVNEAVLQRYGYIREEIVGSTPDMLADPEWKGAEEAAACLRRAIAGEPQQFEWHARTKDGEVFLKDVTLTPGEYFGQPVVIAVGRDITERRRVELERERLLQELQVERSRLVSIFQQAPAFMATVRGPDHVFDMVNPAYRALVGDRPLEGRPVREALPELVAQGVIARLDSVFVTGEPFIANEIPVLLRREEEGELEERILSFVYQPLREADESISGVLAHGVDVTEQVRAQERLRAAEAHYRRLVETAPEAIYALDADGCFIELNPAGERLLQREAADVIGQHFGTVIVPEDLGRAEGAFVPVTSGEADYAEVEARIHRPSGEECLLQITETVIREGGAVIGVHGIARDITEEREREEQMRLLTAVLDRLEQGVSIVDTATRRRVYTNAGAVRLLGDDLEPGSEYELTAALPDEAAREQLREIENSLRESGKWSGRVWRRRTDTGAIVPLDVVCGAVEREPGQFLLFTIMQDASGTITRERHLRRVERLASVGTLISGVAHELNNPLHAIRGFTELLLQQEHSDEDREDLETIRQEAERAAKIVSDLKQVTRNTQEDRSAAPVDLNEVVQHVLRVRQYSLKINNIQVRVDLAPDLPPVWADRSDLEQVIINLVVNAEQATKDQEQRRILLRTAVGDTGPSLSVIDNGPGIRAEDLDQIFDPFFTTKPPGEGTGLGLSISHNIIVTEHGGEISVDSVPGRGTTFQVRLPRAP